MFDIGMAEMVVIGVVALIVVGPKDLPQMFRRVGQFVGKARGMARDFQRAMDQAADQAGVGDVAADLKQATSMKNLGLDDATKSFQDYQKNFEPKKVDAAAEHAKRLRAAEAANKAGSEWPPEGVELPVAAADEAGDAASKATTVAKKAAAKKPAAKKTAAKKTAAKKPAAKKPTSKASASKTAVKKPAAEKTAAKTPDAEKPVAKKAPAKKAPAKKKAAKKTTKASESKA